MLRELASIWCWLLVASFAAADTKSVTIPLDQIWAWQMPGTRDVQNLVAEYSSDSAKKYWTAIEKALLADVSPNWPREGDTAHAAFAVSGDGIEALRASYDVLVEQNLPKDSFRPEKTLSIVFFSYQCESLIELRRIERQDNVIEIHYRFVRPFEKILPAHFAIIPLGELPAGTYRVDVVQESTGRQSIGGSYLTPNADSQLNPC